jgi:hypothetical protein
MDPISDELLLVLLGQPCFFFGLTSHLSRHQHARWFACTVLCMYMHVPVWPGNGKLH